MFVIWKDGLLQKGFFSIFFFGFILSTFLFDAFVFCNDFIGTTNPGAFTEYLFHVFRKDYFTINENLSQTGMTVFVFREKRFGAFVLLAVSVMVVP